MVVAVAGEGEGASLIWRRASLLAGAVSLSLSQRMALLLTQACPWVAMMSPHRLCFSTVEQYTSKLALQLLACLLSTRRAPRLRRGLCWAESHLVWGGLSSCGGGPVMCTTVATQVMKHKQSSPCSHWPPVRIVSWALWAPTKGLGPTLSVAKHLLKYFGCPKHYLTTPPP